MADPRIVVGTQTANERILEAAIRHALFVQRYGAQLGNEMVADLDKFLAQAFLRVQSAVGDVSSRGIGISSASRRRIQRMLHELALGSNQAFSDMRASIYAKLRVFGREELNWQFLNVQRAIPGDLTGLGLTKPPIKVVSDVLERRPLLVQGKSTFAREAFSAIPQRLAVDVRGAVDAGLAQGETVEQIMRRLESAQAGGKASTVFGRTRANLRTAAKSILNHVANQSREIVYQANKQLLKGVLWVSVLDTRTSEICISLDGKIFPVGGGRRPPAHWNCRSTTVPVLKSWQALRKLGLGELTAEERAALAGDVPVGIRYEDWLRRQPAWIQDLALGPKKAKLFRDGVIRGRDLVDATGQPLTLKELLRLSEAA